MRSSPCLSHTSLLIPPSPSPGLTWLPFSTRPDAGSLPSQVEGPSLPSMALCVALTATLGADPCGGREEWSPVLDRFPLLACPLRAETVFCSSLTSCTSSGAWTHCVFSQCSLKEWMNRSSFWFTLLSLKVFLATP